jgi:malonyl-CoA O-methyltransferase
MTPEPFFTDPRAVRRHADLSATHFDTHAVLHREVASRMNARLDYIKLAPARTLDLGAATGAAHALLQPRYPQAQHIGVDFSHTRLKRAAAPRGWLAALRNKPVLQALCADMSALPLRSNTIGLAWSNLALHWLNDPAPAIAEAHRVLEVGGLFMFSCLGPDTLRELRDATRGTPRPHVHRFIDLHDIGDVLVATGFATPVMDVETITLTYASAQALHADLRHTGSHNAAIGRPRGLSRHPPSGWEQVTRPGDTGRFAVRFEVIYGHAWKPEPRRTRDGEAIVRFDRLV